jgi:hypothetical protein
VISIAKDILAEEPHDQYLKNLSTVVSTNGMSDCGQRAVVPELTGRSTILLSDFERNNCLHFNGMKRKPKESPLAPPTLMNRAEVISRELKKYYSMWRGMLNSDGSFPSGKKPGDLKNELRKKIYLKSITKKITSTELDVFSASDEDDEEGDDGDEDSVGADDTESVTLELASQSDDEVPDAYLPPHWWAFLIVGPYASSYWGNVDVHFLLAIENDMKKPSKAYSQRGCKRTRDEEESFKRDIGFGRGLSAFHQADLAMKQHVGTLKTYDSNIMAIKISLDSYQKSYEYAKELKLQDDQIKFYRKINQLQEELEVIRERMNEAEQSFRLPLHPNCESSAAVHVGKDFRTPPPSKTSNSLRNITSTRSICWGTREMSLKFPCDDSQIN